MQLNLRKYIRKQSVGFRNQIKKMSGSSSSSWTCYLCPFATSRINQLKVHIDKAHLNLTGESKSTADNKIKESFIKKFLRKTPPKLSKTKYVQLQAETLNLNAGPKQKGSTLPQIKSPRNKVLLKPAAPDIVQSQSSQEETLKNLTKIKVESKTVEVNKPISKGLNISIKDTNQTQLKLFSLKPIPDILSKPQIENDSKPSPTPADMNINEVYGSICQKECEILSMLTETETIVIDSDEEEPLVTTIIDDDEVEFLEFTNSVSSLKDVFTPSFNDTYKCAVCPFVTFSRRGLKNHKSRSHSLRKSPAEDGKQQKKIVDFFKMSPKLESSDKNTTMSNGTLVNAEPKVNTQQTEIQNLESSPSSTKRARMDAKKVGFRGLAKNLAILQMKGIQCQHCLFRAATKALIDIHIKAQHKNKSMVNLCTSETSGIKILKVHKENDSQLDKTKESILINPYQNPRPKVDTDKPKIQKENFTNFQKETSPNSAKFQKVTKPQSPTVNKNVCKECTETFTSLRSLQFHLKNVHKPSEGRRGPSRRYYRKITNDSYLKYFCQQSLEGIIFQCSICPKQLSSTKALNRHIDMNHNSFYNSTIKDIDILHELEVPAIISECNVAEEMTQNDFLSLFSLVRKSS